MRTFGPPHALLAVQVLAVAQVPAERLEFVGGDIDDQAFARAAAGLRPGVALDAEAFQAALEAIRATDRFRVVEGSAGRVVLDPWPPCTAIEIRGDAPPAVRKTLFPGLKKGQRVGTLRLEVLRAQGQERLVAAGYPQAKVAASHTGERIVLDVATGPPNLIRTVEVVGKTGPFTAAQFIREIKVKPGRTLWNRDFEIECLRRLRKKLVGARRFESRVDLDWDAGGTLRITLEVGPRVTLKSDGSGLGWTTRLKDLVPLTRADRYAPELLDEGERRIVRLFRSRGHLDPQVTYTREVTRTGPDGPEEVVVTYHLAPGPVTKLGSYAFEGNKAIGTRELQRAAKVGGGLFTPKARPEIMDAAESRIEALYEAQGFTEVKMRRNVELKDGKADLLFRIREGRQRLVSWARLELPPDGFGDPVGLGACLPLLFADKPVSVEGGAGELVYRSDRPVMAGCMATLTTALVEGRLRVTLTFSRPIPLLKADFFRAYTAIRQQRLVALGVLRPVVRATVVDGEAASGILFEVPDQAKEIVDRVVVRGSENTRAKAVLREINLKPGDPLDQDKLSRAQGRLGALGGFQRVEVTSLADGAPEMGPPSPWKAGDLLFRAEERSPWVVTNSFGYDRTQGYYLGAGVQRLNVGGMGRVLDFNVRAGDGTINDKTLRDIFPTGQYTRSLDSFSLAYSDPWFEPGKLGEALPQRTAFRLEGAYIQEQRYIYMVRRRRVLSSLAWVLPSHMSIETGYRFERVEVSANVPGLTDDVLAKIAKYPVRAIISSPYAQVVRDTRDNAFDPTSGMYSLARFEAASQFFLTSKNSSFIKLDLRNQWTWPVGYKASGGVVAFGVRLGLAVPTAKTAEDLPLSERFFAGGSGTQRGVEPDFLGPLDFIPVYNSDGTPKTNPGPGGTLVPAQGLIPLGGQMLAIANLEYRFPLVGQTLWGEIFVDSGQVYQKPFRTWSVGADGTRTDLPIRTSLGLGFIVKLGIPLKVEYAADIDRILGRPRSDGDRNTQLRNVTISAGFQF